MAAAGLGVYAAYHALGAGRILAGDGKEAPFGNLDERASYFLSALSPSDKPFGFMVGILTIGVGAVGLYRRRLDAVARVASLHAAALGALTLLLGRAYWGFTIGPLLAAFAPAAFHRTTVDPWPPEPQPTSAPNSTIRSSTPTATSSR